MSICLSSLPLMCMAWSVNVCAPPPGIYDNGFIMWHCFFHAQYSSGNNILQFFKKYQVLKNSIFLGNFFNDRNLLPTDERFEPSWNV